MDNQDVYSESSSTVAQQLIHESLYGIEEEDFEEIKSCSIRIKKSTLDRFDDISRTYGKSRAWLLRSAMETFISGLERELVELGGGS